VIEDLEHLLEPLKFFGGPTHSFATTGAENLAETRHHQLKTPITP